MGADVILLLSSWNACSRLSVHEYFPVFLVKLVRALLCLRNLEEISNNTLPALGNFTPH